MMMGIHKLYAYYTMDRYDEPYLYAWSITKKIAKRFEATRQMDRYIKRIRNVPGEDLEEFFRDYGDQELDDRPFIVQGKKKYTISTRHEWITTKNTVSAWLIRLQTNAWVDVDIFTDEACAELRVIHYPIFYMANCIGAPSTENYIQYNELDWFYSQYSDYIKQVDIRSERKRL